MVKSSPSSLSPKKRPAEDALSIYDSDSSVDSDAIDDAPTPPRPSTSTSTPKAGRKAPLP